ncbi:hypothetical protein HXX76_014785 [Chlamydomonas incerta]|uniref:Uncharacterized protein n=1 Tax=Chlamydomonas incerta TaxID=51695 RepID=A0A835SEK3_CHLIN|nr:hypothetical protein HXX76_014785 [Chlamydomonas incerta]|eukprot:KAG2424111.1 hypothetical protein HXX76_014785 [Chlamydomonas incerta]
MDFKSISGEYDVSKKTLKTACKLKVADNIAVKLKLANPGAKPGVEVEYKGFEVTYDVKSKDFSIEKKFKLKAGELKIKQKVPGMKTELLPSPEVQWKSHIIKGKKFSWEVEPSYCFQARKAKLDQVIEVNGGKDKLKLEFDSKVGVKGLVGTLTHKVGQSWAKQLSAKYSQTAGPSLIHEVEPSKKVSLKSTVGIKARDLKIVAEVKPGKVAGVKPKITLEGKISTKAPTKPTGIIAGLHLDV